MPSITIDTEYDKNLLEKIKSRIGGEIEKKEWGEHVLTFDNEYGNGIIKTIDFDSGVSLIDYDVTFSEETILIFKRQESNPLVFFYITEGNLEYCCDDDGEQLKLNQFQNIIINNKKYSHTSLKFKTGLHVKVNFIQVGREDYLKLKDNSEHCITKRFIPIVKNSESKFVYSHLGNYNLEIAQQIKKISEIHGEGIIKALSLEAQVNLVLAMQLLDHENFVNQIHLPKSISIHDIKKINKLTEFIEENISEPLPVSDLVTESGLSAKKMQAGFNALYSKSVNVYIREKKLDIARDMLKETDDSVSEIVYNIGFKSRSYFSKIFFERFGILPTAYRKKLHEGQE